MDGRRFDSFVVTLGRATTRRQWIQTCAAGLLAAAFGVSRRGAGAQDDTSKIQRSRSPLPNFPFLAVMPTDNRFSAYAVDDRLTGPPTRYRSLEAMTALPDDWRAALGPGFQSAYAATVASPRADDQGKPKRGITTVIFDLGSKEAADQARADYVAALFLDPSLTLLDGGSSDGSQIVLGGCEGGCENLRSPVPSSAGASSELVVVGSRGQFLFDARLRDFENAPVDRTEGDSVNRLIDGRLQGVTSLTAGASAAQSAPSSGGLRLFSAVVRPPRSAASRALAATDDLRNALASRNTLPIFDLGSGDPPLSAKQSLVVDHGAIVVKFGESPAAAAARQRSAEDVVFACATEQALPLANAYHGGYDLTLSTVQYVFANDDDALEFLDETRERLQRDRPRLVLTDVLTTDQEIRDVFQDGRESRGLIFGCLSHQLLRLGPVAAILAVEISAKPRAAGLPPIDVDDLKNELCPVVEQSAEKFVLCIVTPDACQSAFPLTMAGATQPTPTPGPTCNAPMTICGGQCVDTTQNPYHCGACGVPCAVDYSCIGGQCQCVPGLTDCGGYCSDLSADSGNCGGCGQACGPNEFCSAGECICADGSPRCGGICCDQSWTCESDTCIEPCADTQIRCNGICVDQMSDNSNCGSCDNPCVEASCCGGTCTDPYSDPNNCGACGVPCAEGGCCSGVCADLMNDPSNCGSCDNNCGTQTCCSGGCTDTYSDVNNCGTCGNACGSGDSCYSGTCMESPG